MSHDGNATSQEKQCMYDALHPTPSTREEQPIVREQEHPDDEVVAEDEVEEQYVPRPWSRVVDVPAARRLSVARSGGVYTSSQKQET